MTNQSCPECGNDGGFCNFCGAKPDPREDAHANCKGCAKCEMVKDANVDPYLAQGKNFTVHHPVQPKTQVEKWLEEYDNNEKAIDTCGCELDMKTGVYLCHKQGTDNCNKRKNKNNWIDEQISQHHEKNKTYLNRYVVGEFADDKVDSFTGANWIVEEKSWLVTLLDKLWKIIKH